jgi:hypothetical protein
VFRVDEGNLLGHVVSNDGVKIDPARIKAIQKIPLPQNNKSMKYFLEKSISLDGLSIILRKSPNPFQKCQGKRKAFKWDDHSRVRFQMIKDSMGMAPILLIPNYSKEFLIFSFSSEETIIDILL